MSVKNRMIAELILSQLYTSFIYSLIPPFMEISGSSMFLCFIVSLNQNIFLLSCGKNAVFQFPFWVGVHCFDISILRGHTGPFCNTLLKSEKWISILCSAWLKKKEGLNGRIKEKRDKMSWSQSVLEAEHPEPPWSECSPSLSSFIMWYTQKW